MGRLGRIATSLGALCLGGPPGLLSCAPGSLSPDGEPRLKLTPVEISAEPRSAAGKRRLTDEDGQLLPSGRRTAGIVLPRGLTDTHHLEHEWYFQSHASIAQLQRYFGRRLLTGKVERGGMGSVTYVEAQPTDTDRKAFVTVRIGPAPGDRKRSEVLVRETPMMPVAYPSDAEAQKKLEDLRRYAD